MVRTPEGQVLADPTGRANGRGAYFCAKLECWVAGVSKGRLGQALNAPVPDEVRRELLSFAEKMFGSEGARTAPG